MDKNKLSELGYVAGIYVGLVILFKILFSQESFGVIFRVVSSVFWLFILPGFFLMYYWWGKFSFLERFVVGAVLGLSINIVFGYNLGVLGVEYGVQVWLFSLLGIGLGLFFFLKK